MFKRLLTEKVVHTRAQSEEWLTVKEAIFHRLPEDTDKELLLRVLLSANVPLVTVPSHVLSAIDVYGPCKSEVTPYMVRHVLRQVPWCYTSLRRKEKLLLLRYSLSDRQFADLCGLQLLPLANGTFAKFGNRANAIFIDSPEHPQKLFPALCHRFVDKSVDEDILQNLKAVALHGRLCSSSYFLAYDLTQVTESVESRSVSSECYACVISSAHQCLFTPIANGCLTSFTCYVKDVINATVLMLRYLSTFWR